ncbi:MAG: DsbE family thiol:disulfide interchange protein [Pseudomonadota bacterium]
MRYFIPIAVLAALAVFFVVGLNNDPTRIPSPLLARPLPAFELNSLDQPPRIVTETVFDGAPRLLNVWGSWCFNCRVEHDFLLSLSRNGVIDVVGLNWNDERVAAQQWLQELGDPYLVSAFDGEGRVAIDLGVYGAPETFLIDGDGTVVYKHIGPLNADIWQRDFVPRLAMIRDRKATTP